MDKRNEQNQGSERARRNVEDCWNEETREFDWDYYQYLCDIADYWDCEE